MLPTMKMMTMMKTTPSTPSTMTNSWSASSGNSGTLHAKSQSVHEQPSPSRSKMAAVMSSFNSWKSIFFRECVMCNQITRQKIPQIFIICFLIIARLTCLYNNRYVSRPNFKFKTWYDFFLEITFEVRNIRKLLLTGAGLLHGMGWFLWGTMPSSVFRFENS